MWVELFCALVERETDQGVADRVNEAGGAVGRQSVGSWRHGATLPTRRNLLCLFQAFDATKPERAALLAAWLSADQDHHANISGRVVAVIDTETTGLPEHDWAGVIEVGIVVLNAERQQVATFQSLISPAVMDARADKALKINGIDRDMITVAPGQGAAIIAVRQFLRAWGYPPLVAYNAVFDREMLERAGLSYRAWHCLKERAELFFGHRISLDKCCQVFEIDRQEAHRALGDAIDAAELLKVLEARAKT